MLLLGCPLHRTQYLLTLQPILHVGRAHLLSFPVNANLLFPQGSSALSGDFPQPLTDYAYQFTARQSVREVPQKIFAVPPLRSPIGSNNQPLEYRFRDQALEPSAVVHRSAIDMQIASSFPAGGSTNDMHWMVDCAACRITKHQKEMFLTIKLKEHSNISGGRHLCRSRATPFQTGGINAAAALRSGY